MNPNIPDIGQLKELSLPVPVSYAPQTWGWWLLLALLVVLALMVGVRRYVQWRRDQYRREALVRLAQLRERSDDLNALRELPELLKRVALSMPTQSRNWNATPVGAGLLAKASAHPTLMAPDTALSRASPLPQSPAALGKDEWQGLAQLRRRSADLNALRELPELLKRVALSMPTQSRNRNTTPVGAGLLAKASAHPTLMAPDTALSRASPLPQSPAALGKDEWQAFLQQHCKTRLPDDFSAQLALLAYAPDATLRALPAEQRQALFDTCQHWVEQHHVAA
mgnify:CR=1 FL=1